MKYEIYKEMNESQQKEYDYKFRTKPLVINIQGVALFSMLLISAWILTAMTMFVILKFKEDFVIDGITTNVIRDSFVGLTRASGMYSGVLLAFMFGWAWSYSWRIWQLKRWVKKEHIELRWWQM